MGELFSREMEKEHPKLNYRSLNVTADLSYFSQCPLRPIISLFPLSSGLVSFRLISRGELFPQKKQKYPSASQTGNAVLLHKNPFKSITLPMHYFGLI